MVAKCHATGDQQNDPAVTIIDRMRRKADDFAVSIGAQPGSVEEPVPAKPPHGPKLVWVNRVFTAPSFRRAHVEWLEILDVFAVAHVVILPRLNDPAPIFGFDMIAGRKQATGIFLDFSPVVAGPCVPDLNAVIPQSVRDGFSNLRVRPVWGNIFSPEFFAIRPTSIDEIELALSLADTASRVYLDCLGARRPVLSAPDRNVVNGHAAYGHAQRLNPHTFNMLSRYIGPQQARVFIDDVLFPLPN